MAIATTQSVIEGESRRRPVEDVSTRSLLAYARERLAAAAAFPKARLVRRDFRLARLDMTVWFASEALADLCGKKLVLRESPRSFEARAEIFALDAEAEGWEMPPASASRRFRLNWAYPLGRRGLRFAFSCIGPMRPPACG